MKNLALTVFLALALSACATNNGSYRPVGERYPPRPGPCAVAIFREQAPSEPHVTVAQLNVHLDLRALNA